MPRSLPIVTLILLLAVVPHLTVDARALDPLATIARDYDDGRLSLDEKVLLQIQAIKSPNQLPDRYRDEQLAAADPASRPCATPALIEIRSEWDLLAPETQAAYSAAFARVTAESLFVAPSGYFKLHFDTTGVNAVPTEDLDLSGIPDFVEKCAAYLDTALAVHQLEGYRLPPSDNGLGGDNLYDVYFENTGYYGYAVPEGPGSEPWGDAYSYLVLNNDFLGFPANFDPEGNQAGAAKATCAHEFHHAVQFAYDDDDDIWFMEMDATHMEDIVYDQVDDNYNYLPTFVNAPERALMESGSHVYSTFLWGIYLAERFDSTLMPAIWDGARYQTTFSAMTDTLLARHNCTLDSAFAEFATWNFFTSTRDDGLHYGETIPYNVKIGRSHSNYPVALQTSPTNPAGFGACYVNFFPGAKIGKLNITVNGDDARQWDAYVIKSTSENVHSIEKMTLADLSFFGAIEIPSFESYYRVTLVVANTMPYSSGAFFSYSAQVIPPFNIASAVVTTDSAVYSGDQRNFEYLISNVAPVSDILDVTAWDNAGWIFPDTIAYSLSPESDSVVTIAVAPPAGTPLESLSTMWFKVTSRGNPALVDSQLVMAKTVLQRGDADFSGSPSVGDLTYIVNFLFREGAEPIPVYEAGDFNCDTFVNIGDLTRVVQYLFQGGASSPCNPY